VATETLVQTVRSTGNIESQRLVRDVSKRITLLDPSAAPLTNLLVRAEGRSRKVTNPKFEMMELRRPGESTTVSATVTATTTATTITVASDDYFMANDVIMDVTTHEVMLVQSATGNLVTVVRAIGGDIGALNAGATLLRIGNSQPENSSKPGLLSRNVEFLYNYIQIQRKNWAASQTLQDTETYGEKDEQTRNRESSIEHMVDLEKTLWFGKRDIRAGTTFPQRFTGGVFWFLDQSGSGSVLQNVGGTLSQDLVNSWAEDLFLYDDSPKVVFCGMRALTAYTNLAQQGGHMNLEPGGKVFGLNIRRIITAHGVLNLVRHPLFGRIPAYTGYAVALTMKNLRLAFQGAGRTRLWKNQESNDVDGVEHGLRSANGFELLLPETHGYQYGITG